MKTIRITVNGITASRFIADKVEIKFYSTNDTKLTELNRKHKLTDLYAYRDGNLIGHTEFDEYKVISKNLIIVEASI